MIISRYRFFPGQGTDVVVVGDLHGSLADLLSIFELVGWPSQQSVFIFNGDFVDRGDKSCEASCRPAARILPSVCLSVRLSVCKYRDGWCREGAGELRGKPASGQDHMQLSGAILTGRPREKTGIRENAVVMVVVVVVVVVGR